MSASYTILSPLSAREMLELERAVEAALEAYLGEHPDCDDEWGEMSAGGTIPSTDDVRGAYASLGLVPEPDLFERLAACRSAFSIDRPGDIETTGGLQVSLMRYLLERAGRGLVMLADYPLEPSERVLARLGSRRGAKGFGVERAPKRRPVARREAKPGEVRALRLLSLLQRAIEDVRVGIDVKAALLRVSPTARQYAALLLEEGAVSDALAAKALGVPRAELALAADELDTALRGER